MRLELNDEMMNDVNGGTVVISKNTMNIGFTTRGEKYALKNCTYRQARDLRDDLLEAHPELNNSQYDNLVYQEFKKKGWI